jgi:hypothetical protein
MFGENSIYEHLVFTKTSAAILDKARSKADYLVEKIKIRGDELARVCKDRKIDAVEMLDAIRRSDVSNSYGAIPNEEVAKIQELSRRINENRAELKRVELVLGNLSHVREFELSFVELEYWRF